jgi:hypothetical protein
MYIDRIVQEENIMKILKNLFVAAMAATLLSGCAGAAFNRVNMTVSRNITIGQELLDLQAAHEKGIINDTEYAEAKLNVLNVLSTLGEIDVK